MKNFKLFLFLLLSVFFLNAVSSFAQVEDAGLWTSINLDMKLDKNLSVSLSEEVRLNENISEVGSFFTDIGLNYKINKTFKAGGFYRYTNKRRIDNSYSERQRFYFDLAARLKDKAYTYQIRVRYQSQYTDLNKSPTGSVPDNYLRSKASIKYEKNKLWSYFGSLEVFTPIGSNDKILFDNLRINFGVEYSFNKASSLDFSYLIQKEFNVSNPRTDYVLCIGYNYSF